MTSTLPEMPDTLPTLEYCQPQRVCLLLTEGLVCCFPLLVPYRAIQKGRSSLSTSRTLLYQSWLQ